MAGGTLITDVVSKIISSRQTQMLSWILKAGSEHE